MTDTNEILMEPPMKKIAFDESKNDTPGFISRIHRVLLLLTEPIDQSVVEMPTKEVLFSMFDPNVAPPPTPDMLPASKREDAAKLHDRVYKDGHTFNREKLSEEVHNLDYLSGFEVLDSDISEEAFYWIYANTWNPKPVSMLKPSPDYFYVYQLTCVYDPTGVTWFEFDTEKDDTPATSVEFPSDSSSNSEEIDDEDELADEKEDEKKDIDEK